MEVEVKVEDSPEAKEGDRMGVEVQVEEVALTGGRVPHVAEAAETVGAVPVTPTPDTRHRDMLTNLLGSPASGTGPMGSLHIFAWNQAPVRGRTSSSPKPIIETLTSSKNQKTM